MLAYCIDKGASDLQGILTIRLEEGTKHGLEFIPGQSKRPLNATILHKIATPSDKAVVDFLIKEELRYQRQASLKQTNESITSFNIVHITPSQSIAALKLMAQTGNLFFKNRTVIADFFGSATFSYLVKSLSPQQISISGLLKWGEHEIGISDCDFISQGNPHWFIRGLSLKLISTDVAWKDLKRLFENGSFVLEGKQKDSFLQDEQEHILIQGDMHQASAFPILVLKDRLGAFSDLWIDYGNDQRAPVHDPSSKIAFNRQLDLERGWEKDLLETDYIKKHVDTSHYYCPVDKVSKSLLFLLEVGWQVIDWKGNKVLRQQQIDLQMESDERSLVIKGKVHYDTFEADISNVIGAFNRRERFVQIGTGTVGLLPESVGKSSLQALVEEGEIVADGIRVKKCHLGAFSDLLGTENGIHMTDSLKNLGEQIKNFSSIKEVSTGPSFIGALRPYQQIGLNWLSFLWEYGFHGLLADDMGLGKTVQILALLSRLPVDKPHLIIMPTSLLFNWKKEIEKFLPSVVPYLHYGISRSKDVHMLSQQKIILTTYATLRLDLPLLAGIHYQTVILDEAQIIKNPHTQTATAACKLRAQLRLSITGTPIENSLQELWSHFRFLMPDLLGEETEFTAELQSASVDVRYLQRIRKKIRPFILRREKGEVAKDLPERIEQVVWVQMSSEQCEVYESFLASVKTNVLKKVELDGVGKHRIEILEAILRLRQICCHPLLIGNASSSSAKLDTILEDLAVVIAEGRKVIVYSQFTSMLKLIAKAVQEHNWTFAYLDGQTQDREKVVASFQEDASIPLFLISLKAGGVGLNLTAADYVFLVDPWWNDAVEEQAINRAHRIGRKNTVIAKRYVMIESIEEKMMKLKALKRKLAADIFDEEALSAALTIDDLRALLNNS